LRRDRPLVALDQVDVARRHGEPLGHLGLRQAELLPDPAKPWADKQFLAAFGRRLPFGHAWALFEFYRFYKLTHIGTRLLQKFTNFGH
jgi:hypothetical protein